jgi:hypothetical protein
MKNYFSLLCALALITLLSCGSKDGNDIETADLNDNAGVSEEDASSPSTPQALCIWKEVSIRETPSEKGKYRTTVYLGEKLHVMPDTASETVNDKIYNYQLVKLGDGTQGWIRKEFIAINAVPAAFLHDAMIYKRPDLMTSSKKNYTAMDFVAVKNTNKDGWTEVIGKRSGDTWFTTGWVKNENLTMDQKDVMFSVLYLKAMDITDEVKRSEEVQNILMTSDLTESVFYTRINESYSASTEKFDALRPMEVDTTSNDE